MLILVGHSTSHSSSVAELWLSFRAPTHGSYSGHSLADLDDDHSHRVSRALRSTPRAPTDSLASSPESWSLSETECACKRTLVRLCTFTSPHTQHTHPHPKQYAWVNASLRLQGRTHFPLLVSHICRFCVRVYSCSNACSSTQSVPTHSTPIHSHCASRQGDDTQHPINAALLPSHVCQWCIPMLSDASGTTMLFRSRGGAW